MGRRVILVMMRGHANRSQAFLLIFCVHFSTIVPRSDNAWANTLQQIPKLSRHAAPPMMFVTLLLAALCACKPAPEEELPPADNTAATLERVCGDAGFLSAQLFGSIERSLDWTAGELHCESMMRPDGEGVRLRFTGSAAQQTMAIILALPTLERGQTGGELPTVVTLTVEGSGRFFSTPNLKSCFTDISTQQAVAGTADTYDIAGTLFCVSPLGEINGDAAISIPELAFRGFVEWSAK